MKKVIAVVTSTNPMMADRPKGGGMVSEGLMNSYPSNGGMVSGIDINATASA